MSEYEELGTQFDGEPVAVEPEAVAPEVEPVETPEEQPAETTEQAEHRKKTGSQRAKERAIRAETEAAMLRQQLAEIRAGAQPAEPKVSEGEPREDEFATYAEYTRALAQHEARKVFATERAKQDQTRAQEEIQTKAQIWDAKVKEGCEKFEDFEELFADVEPPPPAIRDLITGPKVPVEVVHYLLTHPDKHNEINRLSVADAALELGEIKAMLSSKKSEPKKTSQAPAPVKPVAPSGVSAAPKNTRFELF